jgi:hypothetical protein
VTGGEPHHPLDELGAQAASIVSWPGCGAPDRRFPPRDRGCVVSPLDDSAGNALSTASGRFAVPACTRRSVDSVRDTAPFVPSVALGVGNRFRPIASSEGRTAAPGLAD